MIHTLHVLSGAKDKRPEKQQNNWSTLITNIKDMTMSLIVASLLMDVTIQESVS